MSEERDTINSAIERFYEELRSHYSALDEIDPDSELLDNFEQAARALAQDWISRIENKGVS